MTHELKCWPEFYQMIERRYKTYELRRDDRPFAANDVLHLREWCPKAERYTGSHMKMTVTHIMRGPAFGLMEGWVIMSLKLDPNPAMKSEQQKEDDFEVNLGRLVYCAESRDWKRFEAILKHQQLAAQISGMKNAANLLNQIAGHGIDFKDVVTCKKAILSAVTELEKKGAQ